MENSNPEYLKAFFNCPNCSVVAKQNWSQSIQCNYQGLLPNGGAGHTSFHLLETGIALCDNCKKFSIWLKNKMVYPYTGNVEPANDDLPEDIKNDYNEAKGIINVSPRGAAALLRLAIQKLCIHLGEKGNINDAIESLVKKGLPQPIQQALDTVRVIGNHAVHPGLIDLNDDKDIAVSLFGFVNIICDALITNPRKIAEIYNKLPEKDRKSIEERGK